MIYRNIKTGAEIVTESVIMAPNWELVIKQVTPLVEAPKQEPLKEETEPKKEPKEPKKVTKKRTKK